MRSHGPGPLPADTIFGVDDHPPWPTIAVAAAQHVGLIAINFVVALVVLQAAGVSEATRNSAISMVMIMCGLGTLLQACRRGPFGSGYLMPIVASAVYVGPALAAVQLGGLPLLAGMLMFAGAVEMALSRVLHRLRPFFPPEIAGLVIFLVGTTIAVLGVRDMFGIGIRSSAQPDAGLDRGTDARSDGGAAGLGRGLGQPGRAVDRDGARLRCFRSGRTGRCRCVRAGGGRAAGCSTGPQPPGLVLRSALDDPVRAGRAGLGCEGHGNDRARAASQRRHAGCGSR